MLEGRPFTIYTDHKPLTFALGKVSELWTAMHLRQLSYVAKFTTDIRHIPGSENILADTLSRPPLAALLAAATGGLAVVAVAASPVNLDYARIAVNQRTRGDFEGGQLLFIAAALCGDAGGEGHL
jgi:hypothetical protein